MTARPEQEHKSAINPNAHLPPFRDDDKFIALSAKDRFRAKHGMLTARSAAIQFDVGALRGRDPAGGNLRETLDDDDEPLAKRARRAPLLEQNVEHGGGQASAATSNGLPDVHASSNAPSDAHHDVATSDASEPMKRQNAEYAVGSIVEIEFRGKSDAADERIGYGEIVRLGPLRCGKKSTARVRWLYERRDLLDERINLGELSFQQNDYAFSDLEQSIRMRHIVGEAKLQRSAVKFRYVEGSVRRIADDEATVQRWLSSCNVWKVAMCAHGRTCHGCTRLAMCRSEEWAHHVCAQLYSSHLRTIERLTMREVALAVARTLREAHNQGVGDDGK